jgi:hypothetical protein
MDTQRPTEQVERQAEVPKVGAAPEEPTGNCPDPTRLARIEGLLERIVEHMYQVRREEQTREFGLADLFAALAQVIAIAAILGAMLALLKTRPDRGLAHLSLMGALAMQGLAMTLFMLKRRGNP